MKTTKNVEQFKGYFKSLAICHMDNFGKIYLDEYNQPLEVEEVINLLEDEKEEQKMYNLELLNHFKNYLEGETLEPSKDVIYDYISGIYWDVLDNLENDETENISSILDDYETQLMKYYNFI